MKIYLLMPMFFLSCLTAVAQDEKNQAMYPKGGTNSQTIAKRSKYRCSIEAGISDILPKTGQVNMSMFSLNVINMYQASDFVAIGGGIGAEISSQNTHMLPVYAHARFNMSPGAITPIFDASVGYTARFTQINYYLYNSNSYSTGSINDVGHGFIFNPAFGVKVAINSKIALLATAGYKLYYMNDNKYEYNNYYTAGIPFTVYDTRWELFHAFTARLGFTF